MLLSKVYNHMYSHLSLKENKPPASFLHLTLALYKIMKGENIIYNVSINYNVNS